MAIIKAGLKFINQARGGVTFKCVKCNAPMPVARSSLKPGKTIKCPKCDTEHTLSGPNIAAADALWAAADAGVKEILGKK